MDVGWGESIIEKVFSGIESSRYIVVFMSTNSLKSPWVKKEIFTAFQREIESETTVLLPVLSCSHNDFVQAFPFLRTKKYIKFDDKKHIITALIELLRGKPDTSFTFNHVRSYHGPVWMRLLARKESNELDHEAKCTRTAKSVAPSSLYFLPSVICGVRAFGESMELKDYVSLIAIVFSLFALLLGVWNRISNERRADSILYLARYSNVEANLANWHDAFKLYGIDIHLAKKENVSPEMIAYLILFVNSIHAKCKANESSIKEELFTSELRKWIFSNAETVATWKFSKNAFGIEVTNDIDEFISKQALTNTSTARS